MLQCILARHPGNASWQGILARHPGKASWQGILARHPGKASAGQLLTAQHPPWAPFCSIAGNRKGRRSCKSSLMVLATCCASTPQLRLNLIVMTQLKPAGVNLACNNAESYSVLTVMPKPLQCVLQYHLVQDWRAVLSECPLPPVDCMAQCLHL
jgi:hypothetical protein